MSCECEKLRELYERFNTENLEIITNAKNHIYNSAIGNGQDISEAQLSKPSYEDKTSNSPPYQTKQNTTYEKFNGMYLEIPKVIPSFVQTYTTLPKNIERKIDSNIERLEEMIHKAKEESKWMSTIQ